MGEMTNNQKAAVIAIVGGIMMLIAGVTGAAAWERIGEIVQDAMENDSLNIVFQILAILGGLGGLLVILGGLLFLKEGGSAKVGKLLITIGAGFGLIGLIIFIILAIMGDDPGTTLLGALSIGFIGLILSIVARMKVET